MSQRLYAQKDRIEDEIRRLEASLKTVHHAPTKTRVYILTLHRNAMS